MPTDTMPSPSPAPAAPKAATPTAPAVPSLPRPQAAIPTATAQQNVAVPNTSSQSRPANYLGRSVRDLGSNIATPEGTRSAFLKALIYGEPGVGKCLGKDTPVLMFDGTRKAVQEVIPGDLLMGPDSQPRFVHSTTNGWDELYKVTPIKGNSYIVNSEHILSLKMSKRAWGFQQHETANITVQEYLNAPETFRGNAKGWKTGVEFEAQKVPFDPYFLGIWLGDGGSTAPVLWSPEPEIFEYCEEFAVKCDLELKVKDVPGCKQISFKSKLGQNGIGGRRRNMLKDMMRELDLIGLKHKHIPSEYLHNTREVRLQVLAGLVDTDSDLNSEGRGCEITSAYKQLAYDIEYLALSLGFMSYVIPRWIERLDKFYYDVKILGDYSVIPVKVLRRKCKPRRQIKDVLRSSITVEPIGEGEYFGFDISGDRLFLLGDFTVTHNTRFCVTGPRPVYYMSTDNSLLSVRNEEGVYGELLETYESIKADIAKLKNGFAKYGKDYHQVVVMDNVTEMQRIVLAEITKGELAERPDYNVLLGRMQILVREIRNLPCHVIFTAHASSFEGKVRPSLTGKTSEQILGQFDLVAYMSVFEKKEVVEGKEVTKEITRLRCKLSPGAIGKDRSGALNILEEPNLANLIAKTSAGVKA